MCTIGHAIGDVVSGFAFLFWESFVRNFSSKRLQNYLKDRR